MVGPGEVDDDLEPEVKEECNTKYGDVSKVMIYEIPDAAPEEAVRIFIEFKRVESAIKGAVFAHSQLSLLDCSKLPFPILQPWSTSTVASSGAERSRPRSTTSSSSTSWN